MTAKVCYRCKRELPVEQFSKNKTKKDGLEYICKECAASGTRLWRMAHKDQVKEAEHFRHMRDRPKRNALSRRYQERHRAEHIEYCRRYYAEHRAELMARSRSYYAQHRDAQRALNKQWYTEHPEYSLAHGEKRRVLRRDNGGSGVTMQQWTDVLDRYGRKCLACGAAENITMDHVVPLIKHGQHDPTNVQPLCATCNASKGTKTIDYRALRAIE